MWMDGKVSVGGRAGLEVVVADAVQHVAQLAGSAPGTVDLAVLDLYDGRDAVPADMLSPGELSSDDSPSPPSMPSRPSFPSHGRSHTRPLAAATRPTCR